MVSFRINVLDVRLGETRRTMRVGFLICIFFAILPNLPRQVAPAIDQLDTKKPGTIMGTKTDLLDEDT